MGNVRMTHPDREDVVEVSERAFDVLWRKKGWELINPYAEIDFDYEANTEADEVWAEPDTDPDRNNPDPVEHRIPTLESMEEEELREVAAELGIEGHDVLTANELRSLIGNTPEFYDNPADWPDN